MAVQLKTLNGYEFNASALGGVEAGKYALKTDTAPDSEKLGGKAPEYYLTQSDALTLEEIQASTDLTGKIPSASAVRDISSRSDWKLLTTFTAATFNTVDDLTNYQELYAILYDAGSQMFFTATVLVSKAIGGNNIYMTAITSSGVIIGIILRIPSTTVIENATFLSDLVTRAEIYGR